MFKSNKFLPWIKQIISLTINECNNSFVLKKNLIWINIYLSQRYFVRIKQMLFNTNKSFLWIKKGLSKKLFSFIQSNLFSDWFKKVSEYVSFPVYRAYQQTLNLKLFSVKFNKSVCQLNILPSVKLADTIYEFSIKWFWKLWNDITSKMKSYWVKMHKAFAELKVLEFN